MYSLLVIENGFDADYFMDRMQMYELPVLLENIHKRKKEEWEQIRFVSYLIAQTNSAKKISPTDLLKFSWDEDKELQKETAITSYDITRLRDKAKQFINNK